MKIVVNGAAHEVRGLHLQAVLEELGFGGAVVATAKNGEFVAAASREVTELREGDRIEVLAPMQGG